MAAHQSRILPALAGAIALSGCGEPVGPDRSPRIDATPAELQATRVMIDDVRSRLVASLTPTTGADALGVAIDALNRAISAQDAIRVDESARAAWRALQTVKANSGEADAADLAAIDLSISAAAEIIEYPDGTRGVSNLKAQ